MEESKVKKIIAKELQKGLNLSQIQDLLKDEYDYKITFLDLRLMAAEVESIDWKSLETTEDNEEKVTETTPENQPPVAGNGLTKIEVSSLVRPGALTHGTVEFISGAKAEWILENNGRLGLDNVTGQPTEADLADFQTKLQVLLSNKH
ncbi:hypothetical protein AAEX28_10705 [Lentisphaerota bacterium WC36G]|nr:hypothetical protein LJT99_13550 [Lentisphaerae bacterium WC36]